ncbi:hypothetical protein [Argonema galeatum]|uniref:hypothetical protein n=1 Tax=Argonema galeatum TaxID=2942762 RepID=UPI0020129EC4|nr:hypothetical protein [Argonema galeatum]MCL1467878.1 hypothetical protein [Argonema galeatum A003/A1]
MNVNNFQFPPKASFKLKYLWLSASALCLVAVAAKAQEIPLPRPDRNGNYPLVMTKEWVVVDPDPNGLNCRWSSQMPREWMDPGATFPTMNVSQWPVVRRFRKNTRISANLGPAGSGTFEDENGSPWLKVSIGDDDRICLVRANARFVRPVRS